MEDNIPTSNQPESIETPSEKNKKPSLLPPARTIALIVALILVTVGLVYLASYNYEKPKEEATTQQQEDRTAVMQTSLSLANPAIDASSTASAETTYAINVNADTGENKLTVVQLELQYDPLAIANVDISPGDLNPNWAEVTKEIDTENGTIYYILGVNMGEKGISGPGSVAKITFSKVAGFSLNESAIRFLPETLIMAEGYDDTVLKDFDNLVFSFPIEEELTPAPLEEDVEVTTTTAPSATN